MTAPPRPAISDISPEPLLQLAFGFAPVLMIEAGVRIGLFDALEAGPRTLDALAAATDASERGLPPLVNGLAAIGLLERKDGQVALTPMSEAYLLSSHPDHDLGGLFRQASSQLMPGWLKLTEAVKTGVPLVRVDAAEDGPEFFAAFVEGLLPMVWPAAVSLAEHLRVEDAIDNPSVLDLGAGSAAWSLAFARRSTRVTATAVDWPDVLNATRRSVERRKLLGQFTFVGGDLLDADFGAGHHVAVIGHVLHSEGEARSRALLTRTFDALAPGGVLAIAEFLVSPDRSGPLSGLVFALNMLVHSQHGSTYSFEEISSWLGEAGFSNMRQLQVPGPSPLILADRGDLRLARDA